MQIEKRRVVERKAPRCVQAVELRQCECSFEAGGNLGEVRGLLRGAFLFRGRGRVFSESLEAFGACGERRERDVVERQIQRDLRAVNAVAGREADEDRAADTAAVAMGEERRDPHVAAVVIDFSGEIRRVDSEEAEGPRS